MKNITVRKVPGIAKPILLYTVYDENLSLSQPVSVSLDHDEEQFIAYTYDLDLFGSGETEGEALDDLRRSIVHLYLTLKENQNNLGKHAKKVWDYLSNIVEEIKN